MLIIGYSIIWISFFIIRIYLNIPEYLDYFWLLIALNIQSIGIIGIKQPEIFSGKFKNSYISEKGIKQKYKKSTLTPEKSDELLLKLTTCMITDKPFLQSDLTLPRLAKMLDMSLHHLSQVINDKLGLNFFEFINKHRIEEAKKMLCDPNKKHLTIAHISLDAGFNSLSAFNTAFKKQEKTTPSKYQKRFF
jgi:AraC-like DNA-binding protein